MSSENLYQREGVYWIRYNVNGRKVRRSLRTTSLREAQRLKAEILGHRAVGDEIRARFGIAAAPTAGAPVPTFGEVADRYLRHLEARGHLRPQSFKQIRGFVRNWLVPHFGRRRIGDITRAEVEAFVGILRRSKAKRGDMVIGAFQVAAAFRALGRLFRYAMREQLFSGVNPCDLADKPKSGKSRDVVLSEDEAGRLLGQLEGQLREMVTLALYTGLRWGEVCGLSWADVDLESTPATVTIRRSYQGAPKNAASAATVPLHDELATLLAAWKKERATEWLFPSRIGGARKRMSGQDRKVIAAAAKLAGITKRVTPHVFRHTFGTMLYATTTDPKAVQRLMRHAAIQTTMTVYVKDDRPLGDKVNTLPTIRPKSQLRVVP